MDIGKLYKRRNGNFIAEDKDGQLTVIAPHDGELYAQALNHEVENGAEQCETKEELLTEIKFELAQLDIDLPRALEDLYKATGKPMYERVKAVKDKKDVLRAEYNLIEAAK